MDDFDATRKRAELQLLSEYALCDAQNVIFTLIRHNMVASVSRDLQMGQTVRIHRVQSELSSQWYDVKVVKIYRNVELAILECEIDICTDRTHIPGVSGVQQG